MAPGAGKQESRRAHEGGGSAEEAGLDGRTRVGALARPRVARSRNNPPGPTAAPLGGGPARQRHGVRPEAWLPPAACREACARDGRDRGRQEGGWADGRAGSTAAGGGEGVGGEEHTAPRHSSTRGRRGSHDGSRPWQADGVVVDRLGRRCHLQGQERRHVPSTGRSFLSARAEALARPACRRLAVIRQRASALSLSPSPLPSSPCVCVYVSACVYVCKCVCVVCAVEARVQPCGNDREPRHGPVAAAAACIAVGRRDGMARRTEAVRLRAAPVRRVPAGLVPLGAGSARGTEARPSLTSFVFFFIFPTFTCMFLESSPRGRPCSGDRHSASPSCLGWPGIFPPLPFLPVRSPLDRGAWPRLPARHPGERLASCVCVCACGWVGGTFRPASHA